jgi:CBS domain-containing protein
MYRQERTSEDVNPLKVRVRQVFSGNGEKTIAETVHCPATESAVDLRACEVCGHDQGHFESSCAHLIFCDHKKARGATLRQLQRHRRDQRNRTPIRDVMTTNVLCVRPDVSVEAIRSLLLEREISAAPVVDARGAPLGVISKTDLVQYRHDTDGTGVVEPKLDNGFHTSDLTDATVADVMAPLTIAFHEDASVSEVAAAMASDHVHSLPIVGDDGTVVGIVSSLDIVGWYVRGDA